MKIGSKIAMSDGKEVWPVLKAIFKSEFVSHWRDSFYRQVFDRWETVGLFDTEEEAQDFLYKEDKRING